MATTKKRSHIACWLAGVLLAGCALAAGAAAPAEIGRVYPEVAGLEGVLAPPRTVFDRDVVRTRSEAAIVHLDNGQVLRFDPNSSALLEERDSGDVRLKVLSGRVSKLGTSGRILDAGSGSVVILRRAGGRDPDPMEAEAALLEAREASPLRRDPRTPAREAPAR